MFVEPFWTVKSTRANENAMKVIADLALEILKDLSIAHAVTTPSNL